MCEPVNYTPVIEKFSFEPHIIFVGFFVNFPDDVLWQIIFDFVVLMTEVIGIGVILVEMVFPNILDYLLGGR